MSYAIIGFGNVGKALAGAFARKNIEVAVAGRRPPEELAPSAKAIGPTVIAKPLQDALDAEIVILAVPFWAHKDLAKATASWSGKIVIDATNAFGVPPQELGDLPSSMVISRALAGARLVKAFNHLPAQTLAADRTSRGAAGGSCFCRAKTRARQPAWRRSSTNSASPRSRSGGSQREVCSSRREDEPGLRSSSRISSSSGESGSGTDLAGAGQSLIIRRAEFWEPCE